MGTQAINGAAILRAEIRIGATGAWHAGIESEGTAPLAGLVTLSVDGVTFSGAVLPGRSGVSGSRVRSKVIGGKGGLPKKLDAKNYANGPTVGIVVQDLLAEAGETLSATSDSAVLGASLPKWERSEGAASRALTDVLEGTGGNWRVLADGTVWVGTDTFPEQVIKYVEIDEDLCMGVLDIAPDAPDLRPGVTLMGHRITYVVHKLGGSSLRTEAYVVGSPANAFDRIFNGIRREIDFSREYPARVVEQRVDGTLDLMPDSPKLRGFGVSRVPIRNGVPGSVKVPSGARCTLSFENGDPSKPRAALWEGDALTELRLGAATEKVALANLVDDALQEIKAYIDAHVHPSGVGPTGVPTTPMPAPDSVAAEKVMAE